MLVRYIDDVRIVLCLCVNAFTRDELQINDLTVQQLFTFLQVLFVTPLLQCGTVFLKLISQLTVTTDVHLQRG